MCIDWIRHILIILLFSYSCSSRFNFFITLAWFGWWESHHRCLTLARISPCDIHTHRVVPAWISTGRALVDVHALRACCRESRSAGACAVRAALGVVGAVEVRVANGANLDRLAGEATVSLVPFWAGAVVARGLIHADGPGSALMQCTRLALINVCTSLLVGLPCEPGLA